MSLLVRLIKSYILLFFFLHRKWDVFLSAHYGLSVLIFNLFLGSIKINLQSSKSLINDFGLHVNQQLFVIIIEVVNFFVREFFKIQDKSHAHILTAETFLFQLILDFHVFDVHTTQVFRKIFDVNDYFVLVF